MDLASQILSDVVIFQKYARYLPELNRRESWDEIITRNKQMHFKKFPTLKNEIERAYEFVYRKEVLPSMRSLQFGGKAIEVNNARIYNCSYLPMDSWEAFHELMFLLLSGCGVGYSVQGHHIEELPEITKPTKTKRFLIQDSIIGWADSVKALMKAYFMGRSKPMFDFSDIRLRGARLKTSGGIAPGPEPLKDCLYQIEKILERKENGSKLTSLEVHDICCYIAECVLAGGIRRAAMISLFSLDDDDMLTSKFGKWFELSGQRARANNSAVLLRHRITEETFSDLWDKMRFSNSGEPGFAMSNDQNYGTNPSLRAGTKILTRTGIVPIEQLDGQEFEVKNLYGDWSKAKCWQSGKNRPLYKITLSGGQIIYATAEHKWPVVTRSSAGQIKIKKVSSKDLQAKDRFPIITEKSLFEGQLGDYDDGFLIGWLYGDGWITVRKDNGITQYGLCVGKDDAKNGVLEKLTQIINNKISSNIHWSERKSTFEINIQRQSAHKYFCSFGVSHKSNGLPNKIWTECSEAFRLGFIDALISSDGSVDYKQHKKLVVVGSDTNWPEQEYISSNKARISLSTIYQKLAHDFSDLLGFYGISSSVNHTKPHFISRTFPNGKTYNRMYEHYTIRINDQNSVQHFQNLIKLTHDKKRNALAKINFDNIIPQLRTIRVKSVELSSILEDVWDISVFDTTHCFQIAHCITGNCGEIALRAFQFCNLCEINAMTIKDQDDLDKRARAAAFIATLQASYTNLHYLRDIWKQTTEKDSLIGVGLTGIAASTLSNLDLARAARIVKEENVATAKIIGINPAARCTTVKPSGTASLVLGCSSGIHAWHAPYYVRRMKVNKTEPIYNYLITKVPQLIEDDYFKPKLEAVLSIPQKAPEAAITREEPALELLKRVANIYENWIIPGHRQGHNRNNVSTTVTVKPSEWDEVKNWMWKNRDRYGALSVLPYDYGTYIQPPFEDISKETYESLLKYLRQIDLTEVKEIEDNTTRASEPACAGNACEIPA
jgi:ribonucleotide reductase alpha subunit